MRALFSPAVIGGRLVVAMIVRSSVGSSQAFPCCASTSRLALPDISPPRAAPGEATFRLAQAPRSPRPPTHSSCARAPSTLVAVRGFAVNQLSPLGGQCEGRCAHWGCVPRLACFGFAFLVAWLEAVEHRVEWFSSSVRRALRSCTGLRGSSRDSVSLSTLTARRVSQMKQPAPFTCRSVRRRLVVVRVLQIGVPGVAIREAMDARRRPRGARPYGTPS